MSYPTLTECVEILDGHTTNKRDPSDGIQLRSAGGSLVGRRYDAATTLERRADTAENERSHEIKRDGRIRRPEVKVAFVTGRWVGLRARRCVPKNDVE